MIGKILLFIAISLTTFMMVLDYSIANVSLPYIAGSLAVSYEQGTYAITSFSVGSSIGIALTAWIVKRYGEIRVFTLAIVLFTLFSWACGASYTMGMFVINRFLQGVVSGPIMPLSNTLILKLGAPEEKHRNLAIWAAIVILAPVFGPIMGGYISEWHSWPWIFYINIPVGIFSAITIWVLKKEKETPKEKIATDWIGIALMTITVTCFQIFLDKGEQWDWFNSNLIIILITTTVVGTTYFIFWELSSPSPLLNLRLFKKRSFSLSILGITLGYAIYFGTVVTLPIWLQQYMGYTAEWAGLAVCFLGLPPLLFFYLEPIIVKKIGDVYALTITFFIFAISCFYTSLVFTTNVDFFQIAFSRFLFGLGLILFIAPLLDLSAKEIPNTDLPSSTGLFHFIRALVGGVGTSVFTTIFYRRTIFHHERIGSALNLSGTNLVETEQGNAILNNLVDQQASLLAINEVFYLMGFLFVGLILIFLVSKHLLKIQPVTKK